MADAGHSFDVPVRFRDLDPMGHVNNAVYNTYLEESRMAFWKLVEPGRSLETVPFILARAELNYRSPARESEVIRVGVRVAWMGTSSFCFEHRLTEKQGGRLIAEAKSVLVYFDYETGRSAPIPERIRGLMTDLSGGTIEPKPRTE
ncbi:MAG: acyl-CoA thioesterase [Gemmatimonadetes bacterium]|nr:acyl-CoA thioesterase [Gemmatimonadota bacterium]